MNLEYPVQPIATEQTIRTFGRRRMDTAIHALVAVEVSLILGLYIVIIQGLADMAVARSDMRREILAIQTLNKRYAEFIFKLATKQ